MNNDDWYSPFEINFYDNICKLLNTNSEQMSNLYIYDWITPIKFYDDYSFACRFVEQRRKQKIKSSTHIGCITLLMNMKEYAYGLVVDFTELHTDKYVVDIEGLDNCFSLRNLGQQMQNGQVKSTKDIDIHKSHFLLHMHFFLDQWNGISQGGILVDDYLNEICYNENNNNIVDFIEIQEKLKEIEINYTKNNRHCLDTDCDTESNIDYDSYELEYIQRMLVESIISQTYPFSEIVRNYTKERQRLLYGFGDFTKTIFWDQENDYVRQNRTSIPSREFVIDYIRNAFCSRKDSFLDNFGYCLLYSIAYDATRMQEIRKICLLNSLLGGMYDMILIIMEYNIIYYKGLDKWAKLYVKNTSDFLAHAF